jgi:putative Mg2+ transporter-C (MgtC) family protein
VPHAFVELSISLISALLLGASIGLERQWRQRLAGLRTNSLVALGAALFLVYARAVHDDAGAARIAAQVVSGIGFLGAGVIFKEGLNVRGLNTAATLWCSAAVGLLAGEGQIAYGALGAALVIFTNLVLRPLVRAINRQPVDGGEVATAYAISLACHAVDAGRVRSKLIGALSSVPDVELVEASEEPGDEVGHVNIAATVSAHKPRGIAIESVVFAVAREPGVLRSQWRSTTPGE